MTFANTLRALVAATAIAGLSSVSMAANPQVGGADMFENKNIVENAVNSKDHTTLVAAVQAAGLVEALSGPGPFTVFAPTNDAFAKLPAGTVDTLLKPENKATLTKILTSHVVSGTFTAADIIKQTNNGKKRLNLLTLSGAPLTLELRKSGVWIYDQSGGAATVTIADVMQSNGVIHVTNAVSLPK